jgi:S-adenosyl methyltransferase
VTTLTSVPTTLHTVTSNTSDAAEAPDLPSARIDPTKASVARVYDCFLGGKDNYAVDRAVFEEVNAVAPQMATLALAQRAWLGRVTRFLATSGGITQFLDVGAGLPSAENTHEAAQRLNRDARVVYVDNDPVVLAHGRAMLEENDLTHLVDADLFKPDEVFNHPTVKKYLEPDKPVALIQSSTIHHVPDELRPLEIMQRYIELLPSGSYLVLSHFCDPEDGGEATQLARFVEGVFTGGPMGSGFFRTRAEIEAFFGGLEFVSPGVVRLRDWWPDGPLLQPASREDEVLLGGVARKP